MLHGYCPILSIIWQTKFDFLFLTNLDLFLFLISGTLVQ